LEKPAVVFYLTKKNWYSYVPLINVLDRSSPETEIILSKDLLKDLDDIVRRKQGVVCCFSFFTTQVEEIREIVTEIRMRFGDRVKLLAGGPHASGDPEGTLEMGFDAVVRGEGERVIVETISGLLGFGGRPPGSWPIVEGLPLQDLDLVEPVSFSRNLFPPLEITRGCQFSCAYCSVPVIQGRVRHRSLESILKVGERLLEMGPWDFRFISPNSFGYGSRSRRPNEEAVERLLGSLSRLRGEKRIYFGTFPSEVRPDFVTPRLVRAVADVADNSTISLGAQSGSPRILEKIRRGHDLDCVFAACDAILDCGLRPVVDFILGIPGESHEDQLKTLEVMERLVSSGCMIRVHHFLPLPGSDLGDLEPSPIAGDVAREIGRMSQRGLFTGSFFQQMEMAKRIRRGKRA